MSKDNMPTPAPRTLFLTSDVDAESMGELGELTKAIIEINDSDRHLEEVARVNGFTYEPEPIRIYIDSYGGYVYQCFGLIGVMERSETPVHTYVTGCAMSCGFIILIHGHRRFGYRHSTPMYHQVSTGFVGKIGDMELEHVETRRLQDKIEQMTLEHTKIKKARLREVYKTKTDWYMTAEEALELGVIDEIV